MNKKMLKILFLGLFSITLVESPTYTNPLNSDATFPNISWSPNLAFGTAFLYVGYNYLIRQDYLVEKKFEYAYAWYKAMTQKYPQANLEDIYFLQTPSGSFIPDALADYLHTNNWTRQENKIYFPADSLKEINFIYSKIVDGYPLKRSEEQALARYEFMLLHEAAHIHHHDAQNFIIGSIGLLGTIFATEYACNTYHNDTVEKLTSQVTLPKVPTIINENNGKHIATILSKLNLPSEIPAILDCAKGAAFACGIVALLRNQETQADIFACQMMDITTLQDALTLFENDDVDTLYELETKTVMDYVPAESQIEMVLQKIVQPIEYTTLVAAQQFYLLFKKTALTRWIFDFSQNALHQGPSVRADMIKAAIAKKQAQN